MPRFTIRRPNWLALFALFTALVPAVARGESFPYKARISVPGAPVRSGPGEGYYITDTLAEGERVEIYRHRHNGWCAIRPPEDSFSWVFSSHVKLLEDSLAEVDKDDVPSRIGSRLSKRRNAVQVRLNKGEVVQIRGEAEEDGQKWYKIAPPAGEFRWIHASSIGRGDLVVEPSDARFEPSVDEPHSRLRSAPQPPPPSAPPIITISADNDAASAAPAATSSPAAPLASADDWRAAPVAPPLAPTTQATRPPTAADTAATPSNVAAAPIPAGSANAAPPSAASPPPNAITPQTQPAAAVADGLARQLADIELRLSRMVSEPPPAWQIELLEKETEQLLSQAQTVSERDAAKGTLVKLDRFAAIERRYQQIASAPQPGPTSIAAAPGAASNTASDGGRYDAVGVLRPVVSKRPGAPQFALVDERGHVVTFVTAPPDVNLQSYVGQRVGVAGNRGFIPEFHRAHVTAGRVTPLDQRLLR